LFYDPRQPLAFDADIMRHTFFALETKLHSFAGQLHMLVF
jgi:hypothetical protein